MLNTNEQDRRLGLVLAGLLEAVPSQDQLTAAQEELRRVAEGEIIILLGRDRRKRWTGRGTIVKNSSPGFSDLFQLSRRHTRSVPSDLKTVRNEMLKDGGLNFRDTRAIYGGRVVAITRASNMLIEDSRSEGHGPPGVEAGFVVREKLGRRFPAALIGTVREIIG